MQYVFFCFRKSAVTRIAYETPPVGKLKNMMTTFTTHSSSRDYSKMEEGWHLDDFDDGSLSKF